MFTSLDAKGLVDCLSQIPPIKLQAVTMLHEMRQATIGGWFPAVPPDTIAAATSEIIAYTKACASLVGKLAYLSPVIIPGLECPQWPL